MESIAAASISQTQEENSESMQVDMSQLFLQVVGGQKKQRVYGLGSQAEAFYPDSFTGSASSRMRYTLPDPAMEERLREITEEHDKMREAMRQERDEIDKKNEELVKKQEDMSKQQEEMSKQQKEISKQQEELRQQMNQLMSMLKN